MHPARSYSDKWLLLGSCNNKKMICLDHYAGSMTKTCWRIVQYWTGCYKHPTPLLFCIKSPFPVDERVSGYEFSLMTTLFRSRDMTPFNGTLVFHRCAGVSILLTNRVPLDKESGESYWLRTMRTSRLALTSLLLIRTRVKQYHWFHDNILKTPKMSTSPSTSRRQNLQ